MLFNQGDSFSRKADIKQGPVKIKKPKKLKYSHYLKQ